MNRTNIAAARIAPLACALALTLTACAGPSDAEGSAAAALGTATIPGTTTTGDAGGDPYDTAHVCDGVPESQCSAACNLRVGNQYCPAKCRWKPSKVSKDCTCYWDPAKDDPCKPIPTTTEPKQRSWTP